MNDIQIFNYQTHEVRTIQKDGEAWFALKDVANILGIENHKDLPKRLEADEVGRFDLPHPQSPEKTIEMTCINEPGLYNVILRSDKPEARHFRKWVTSEVLPTIRKHGAYMTPETIEAAILNPDTMIKLCTELKAEQERSRALQIENAQLVVDKQIMAPKADYFDELVDRNTLTNFRETAKELHIPPKNFVQFLLDHKYVYRDKKAKLLPYEAKNNGLFEVKECFNEKTQWSGPQTYVTPKGRETFRLLCLMAG